ncbi:phasin family protein [Pseudoduganella chitinolytica]|uniref:Phasin family protein n=1 Tax=Pseudoduganella chitinolytica TaxID=34070 RepID=A0ABY8BDG5_9BURK|nr:phasin family protein [Pseudoduganella chitinolytica]WEF33028.1 phasin family protein [Pseudoduganella chitinolytica]
MTSITEQLSATSKSQLETQLNLMDAVLRKSVEGVQQVAALNLHTARNVFERGTNSARELLAAKDPREILALATRPLPTVEGLLAYSRELFSIASRAQAELLQSASTQFRAPATALVLGAPAPAVAEAPAQVAAHAGEAANAAVHQVADNVQAASEAIARSAQEATQETIHAATQATTQAAQEAAAVAREAARGAVEAAPPVVQATEHVAEAAADNVAQATEAIVAAVAEAAPVTPTAQADDGAGSPKTNRGRPAAKPVAQALADIADKPATTLKSVPGKQQPRK